MPAMETRIWTGLEPDTLVRAAPHLTTRVGTGLLDSAAGGRWSLSGLAAGALVLHPDRAVYLPTGEDLGPPAEALRRLLTPVQPEAAGPAPFRGGWLGYLGYGAGALFDRIPPERPDPQAPPMAVLLWMDATACLDRRSGSLHLCASGRPDPFGSADAAAARDRLEELTERLERPLPGEDRRAPGGPRERPALPDPGPYEAAVRRAREHIGRGDVFQVNLAQRFPLADLEDPWEAFLELRRRNPADYAGYLAHGDLRLLSASPELLVETHGRSVVTAPIAGTHPRGVGEAEDVRIREALRAHPKERAEHVMLVDLERNDLGRVCEYGSVVVTELLGVRSFATVHHLVSTVVGRLRDEVTPFEVLRALFPGGTITGAPKIRATELIHDLEAVPRGPYTGSLGFVDLGGDQTWNILIRTVVRHAGSTSVHAGAGVVWDSDPAREYRESVQKAKVFLELSGVDVLGHTLEEPGPAAG